MAQDGANQPSRFGRLVTPALALGCLVLGAMHLWRWFGPGERGPEKSGVAVEEAIGSAGPDSSLPLVPPPDEDGLGERQRSAAASSWPADAGGAAPRSAGHAQPAAGGLSPDMPGAPGGLEPAIPIESTQGASQPPRHVADSGVGDAVESSPGLPEQEGDVPAQGAMAPEEGAGSPDADTAPETETPAEVEPVSDRTPPDLDFMRFDPSVVEGGGVTTLTIQASDRMSGVKSVRGEIQSPGGLAVLSIWPQTARGGNTFTYTLKIPPAAETGVWFVKWLQLTDVADNSSLIQASTAGAAPPGGTFSVSSSESDSIAPDVIRVWFDNATVEDEARNVVRVEVHDDLSGVASVTGACQVPSRSALVSFTCALNPESGIWEGEVVLPGSSDCGQWVVQQLSAKDNAGNTTLLMGDSPILAHVGFEVAPGEDCDSSPPTLSAFSLTPTVVSGNFATEILVTAAVSDVGSGVVSVAGWFEGPVSEGGQIPKNHFRCTPDAEHPEAPWTGKVVVPQFAATGVWKARVVRLEDRAQNFREYTPADPVLAGVAFEVQ